MCRCLRIKPGDFYAWQKSPLSSRVQEDARQTELSRQAWNDSGTVYGYRKRERIWRRTYKTRDEARQDVFDYIGMFYNPVRKRVRNRMLSPNQFER